MNTYRTPALYAEYPECLLITDKIRDCISEYYSTDLADSTKKQIDNVMQAFGEDNFCITVVGEFSRGKSSLCNALLDRDVIPVGDLPTTSRITQICYGEEEAVSYAGMEGKQPLSERFWETIPAELPNDSIVDVEVNNTWLREQRITLIDTPGIDDIEGNIFQEVLLQIQRSDAVIVMINALMAMSQTEKTFIEEHIVTNRNPKVAVVVSRLDNVNPSEQQRVIDHISNELSSFNSSIPLFCLRGYGDELVNVQPITGLKTLIKSWANSDIRTTIRLRNWGEYMRMHLDNVLGSTKQQKEVLAVHDSEKRKKATAEMLKVEKNSMFWEEARILARDMAARSKEELDRALISYLDEVCDTLSIQLRNAPQPKTWYEELFPLLARREFLRIGKNMESFVLKKLCSDQDILRKKFSSHIPVILSCSPGCGTSRMIQDDSFELPDFELKDLSKTMMYRRVIFGAATAGTFILLGPLGMLVSIGGGIVNELMHLGSVGEQKKWLEVQLRTKILPELFDERKHRIDEMVDDLYSQMLNAFTEQEEKWREQQEVMLKEIREPSSKDKDILIHCENVEKQCTELSREIETLTTTAMEMNNE